MGVIKNYKEGNLTTADIQTVNKIIISSMVFVAVLSIVWSVSIHIISNDFHYGIIGAKIVFRERDYTQMDNRTINILKEDLKTLTETVYTTISALESSSSPKEEYLKNLVDEQNALNAENQTTKMPKVRKIPHLFQFYRSGPEEPVDEEIDDELEINSTVVPTPKLNIEEDTHFLSTMTIDIHQTRWRYNVAEQFVYNFPFMSEIIAIIWTALFFLYQTGIKKYWGLPKPWRIVVPSILVFFIMALSSLIYTILVTGYLKTFCTDLRANLSVPTAISCGQAMSVLRPTIRQHLISHDAYLTIFRIVYMLSLGLWSLAFLVMVLRYIFAVDFQLVDVEPAFYESKTEKLHKESEFHEVPLNMPKSATLDVEEEKALEDFHSAVSHVSEVATPLLVNSPQKIV
ncbi:uncharacterized protein LOC119685401 isoform X2 [Teleopsis dalmanni]|uniref:uncharacterized protein LOC119685401 isoform X2 n=1 Tax=Teleopsis dalmanni TaxID=139649 RepID=UPI0018CE2317|nr:uncharacterized protein LOC119685401 isoform X2 [Teleopsis dalmanni]